MDFILRALACCDFVFSFVLFIPFVSATDNQFVNADNKKIDSLFNQGRVH